MIERPLGELPVRIVHTVELGASAADVFAVLADHERWPEWFGGMRRARIDGPASGVGALRTVWVPPARVQERFSAWDPGERLTLHVVSSSLPGLRAMTEDWRLEAIDPAHTRLILEVGAEPVRWLRPVGAVVRLAVGRATRGAMGIRGRFPMPN